MTSLLIVDDDKHIQKLLSRLFEKNGFDTMTASDGGEALKMYRERRQDIVIMDLIMPNKEGIETIIELKHIDPEVKIIAISGGGKIRAYDYLKMASDLGAVSVMEKPINTHDLLLKINELK